MNSPGPDDDNFAAIVDGKIVPHATMFQAMIRAIKDKKESGHFSCSMALTILFVLTLPPIPLVTPTALHARLVVALDKDSCSIAFQRAATC